MTNKIDPHLGGTRQSQFEVGALVLVISGGALTLKAVDPDTGTLSDYADLNAKDIIFAGGSPAIGEGDFLVAKDVASNRAKVGHIPSAFLASIIGGRLHVGDSPLSDDISSSLVYDPYLNNQIALYDVDAGCWKVTEFTGTAIDTSAFDTNFNFDIYAYLSGGTLTLEAVRWSTDTVRLLDLEYENGVAVKYGAHNKRYLGTVRTDDDGNIQDTPVRRRIWNQYNRARRPLLSTATTNSWTLPDSATAWRAWNSSSDVVVDFVVGAANVDAIELTASCNMSGDYHSGAVIGIAEDAADHNDCDVYPSHYNEGGYTHLSARYTRNAFAAAGYHALYAVERYQGAAFQTTTMYGTDGTTRVAGIVGTCWA